MNASELRNKNEQELRDELSALLREQFNYRMQQGSGQMTNSHLMGLARKNIARVKTVLNEKQKNGGEA